MRRTATIGIALLALTACGSGSDDGGGVASISGDSGSDSNSSDDKEQDALDWARCMRDEGVDIPDPETDENGTPGLAGSRSGLVVTSHPRSSRQPRRSVASRPAWS